MGFLDAFKADAGAVEGGRRVGTTAIFACLAAARHRGPPSSP